MRRYVQALSALLINPFWAVFWKGPIYQGKLKHICAPGLNCYSCPVAVFACPIGTIQNLLASPGALQALSTGKGAVLVLFFVFGFLGTIGVLVGRAACGWACPFGLFQELMYKLPTRKFNIPPSWSYMKYAILVVLVLAFPLLLKPAVIYGPPALEQGEPWFCKILCPAGTLEASLPLTTAGALQKQYPYSLGWLFVWKVSVLFVLLVLMVYTRRPFCRTLCPLGALWGLCNYVSLYQLRMEEQRCTRCDRCLEVCPVQIKIYQSPSSPDCIRCLECVKVCPEACILTPSERRKSWPVPERSSADMGGSR
jgi:polyferredoxin